MATLALRPGHAWSRQPGNCIPIRAVETRGVGTLTWLTAGTGPAPIAGSFSSSPPPCPQPNSAAADVPWRRVCVVNQHSKAGNH